MLRKINDANASGIDRAVRVGIVGHQIDYDRLTIIDSNSIVYGVGSKVARV